MNIDEVSFSKKIMTVGQCTKINELLREAGTPFLKFECVNEVYGQGLNLCDENLIYMDLPSLTVNPFLLQHAFDFFKKNVEFIYLYNDKNELSYFLNDIDELNFSFNVLSYKSKSFDDEIKKQVKELSLKQIAA